MTDESLDESGMACPPMAGGHSSAMPAAGAPDHSHVSSGGAVYPGRVHARVPTSVYTSVMYPYTSSSLGYTSTGLSIPRSVDRGH